MKKLSRLTIGTAIIALVLSSSPRVKAASSTTCSSSAIPVSGAGGNYVYEFTSTADSAQLKICSTSSVSGSTLLTRRVSFGDNNWRGSFVILFDEEFDDEVDIQVSLQHVGKPSSISYTTKSLSGKSWLHAEENSGSVQGYGVRVYPPCGLQDICFWEKLTWKSHSECCFDRDEIDSWNYTLNASFGQIPIVP